GGLDSEALARSVEVLAQEPRMILAPPKVEPPPPEPPRGKTRGKTRGRTVAGRGAPGSAAATGGAASAEEAEAARMAGGGERSVTHPAPVARRPPPNQGDISRVINNNKLGIKTCYQRALLRDSSLTHGKIVVGVTIGLSGRVKSSRVDGPV